ncbi:peptidase M3 [Veronia nyctiphanis]|uniref:Peptidase M3 n=1 Tax=Veronia nyctiphanis TaxID=1278244 RepID=A0A4Q0YVL2_9GAMM|nr:M3 family metallopeptidase [Veronia nyctiphanis]RXJ73209.1 peptidase M3 [Veronia nyctiphanis]
MSNPLVSQSNLPHGAIDFAALSCEHFLPAIEKGIEQAQSAISAIVQNTQAPTFENTIEALEWSQNALGRSEQTFRKLTDSNSSDDMQALAPQISSLMSNFKSDLYLNTGLFKRIEAVYQQAEELDLSPEQKTLLLNAYDSFVRQGAQLDESAQAQLREIDQKLSTLCTTFSKNILAATNAHQEWVTDEEHLSGLPEAVIKAAKRDAEQAGEDDKWLFTLRGHSMGPVLNYADYRPLRKAIIQAFGKVANGDEYCNQEVVKRTAVLRHQRAQLLGYDSFAHYQLADRMAQTPEQVGSFIEALQEIAFPKAKEEIIELQDFLDREQIPYELENGDIAIWDIFYFSEKQRQAMFDFDEQALQPYFEYRQTLKGVFAHATQLFGLQFENRTDLPTCHVDTEVFEVFDADGSHLGLLYVDSFTRDSKAPGAWCRGYQYQGIRPDGSQMRPHVSIVCNCTPPDEDGISLLTLHDTRMLLHEFGHALHMLLSNVHYPSLSCANVKWDFAELPSQILENWLLKPESLALYAKHYQTGETLPEELIAKAKAAEQFQSGSYILGQLMYCQLDFLWHTQNPSNIDDVAAFEQKVLAPFTVTHVPTYWSESCQFTHSFGGSDYAVSYYCYLWANVLDADAFECFEQAGIFDKQTASEFRMHILSKGGSEAPMDLYERFAKRKPDPKALTRRLGWDA